VGTREERPPHGRRRLHPATGTDLPIRLPALPLTAGGPGDHVLHLDPHPVDVVLSRRSGADPPGPDIALIAVILVRAIVR
jgi:hypothetical protein